MIVDEVGEGPIANKIKNKNWENKITKYKLDPTLNWYLAEVISLENNEIKFKTIEKNKRKFQDKLIYKNYKWSIPLKKSVKDIHKIGDIIFVKKKE